MMIGRGSPKFAFLQAKSTSKKKSPKSQRRETSPKTILSQRKTITPRVGEQARASWNSILEKGLVDVMHENMNSFCRTQNGWTPEGWKMIVLGFHDKFPHVTFSRGQIQDKEKELKRDYRCLKDARSQSGVSWDDKLGMIVADDPTLWSNICFSFPPAKKFRNKPFPIFEALGELYDGQTAEGLLSFTSLQPTNTQDQTTNPQDDVVTEIGADEFDN
uniref:Myb/SANT-like domain-containing protein n=1 Tax=Oryza brachyantha TaxID=4533 RepID=J3LTL6_ORYBR